jgi:hypothetical protein
LEGGQGAESYDRKEAWPSIRSFNTPWFQSSFYEAARNEGVELEGYRRRGERYRRKTAVAMRRLRGEGCLSAIPILSKN